MTAATNYHKLGDLTLQKFILSQFWRPEVWDPVTCSPCGGIRGEPLPCLFQRLLPAFLGLRLHGSTRCLFTLPPLLRVGVFSSVSNLPHLSLTRTFVTEFRAALDNPPLENFNSVTSSKSLFQIRSHLQVPEIWCGYHFWGGCLLVYYQRNKNDF